ncbi:hypothetical protein BH09BAC1_BH09BAC1_09490 [soil metagenome]
MWKKRLKWFLIINLVIGLCLFAAAKYQFRYVPKQELAKTLAAEPYDAIIVPGIPFENGEWSWLMKTRVYWAKYLFDKGVARNIIFSGSAVHSPYVEADIMALYALQLCIPATNIFTENQALHSTENVDYSYVICTSQCFKRLAVATDPFQSLWLGHYIGMRKLKIDCLPAVISITDSMDIQHLTIDPSSAFVDGHVPLKLR